MYEQTCKVFNTNTNVVVDADILDFRNKKQLTVSIMKSIKLILKWDKVQKKYIGRYSKMEFVSEGPKEINV